MGVKLAVQSPLRVLSLLLALAFAQTAAAQRVPPAEPAPPEHIDPVENARRINAAGQFFAGLALESVTAMSVVGVSLGIGVAASGQADHGDAAILDAHGARVLLGTAAVTSLLFIPPMTALGVHGVARRGTSPGRYRAAWQGSLGVGAGVFALTLGVSWPLLAGKRDAGVTAAATALGTSFVGFLAGALIGEHRSAGSAPASRQATGSAQASPREPRAVRMVPSLSLTEGRGAALGLAGTF